MTQQQMAAIREAAEYVNSELTRLQGKCLPREAVHYMTSALNGAIRAVDEAEKEAADGQAKD